MMLFHRTDAAEEILQDGFKDGSGMYLFDVDRPLSGVWLSDVPLDVNEGARKESSCWSSRSTGAASVATR
jgi:hypothetical protein